MTQQEKDDLLTEARKRYPIGTVFVPPFGCKDKLTVTGNIFLLPFGDRRIIVETDKGDGRAAGLINTAAISTRSGKWAEIVSKPEETMIEGQWYKAVNKNNHSEWLFKYSANRFGKAEGNNTEFSKCVDLKTKIKSLNNWIGSNKNYAISKVTNLEEVYLHFPEEKHKDKIFIPKYVECIRDGSFISSCSEIKENPLKNGHIYKVHNRKPTSKYDNKICLEIEGKYVEIGCNRDQILYNPSTKEAYDAQFAKKEEPINTYGLKVGDTLRVDILNKWGNSGNYLNNGSITFKECGMFRGDRILDSFYNSPAGVIFKPSGCASGEFGLKAEGFKEFMDNFDKPMKEDKPKFEAGKWYKYTREDIKEPNYAKYSANQSVNDRFYYDEFISINGWKKGHNWSFLTVNPVLLTDLSEIQQYLPDGHEDKIMKPKKQSLKGRYLKALVDSPSSISNAKKGDYFRIDDEYRNSCTLLKNNSTNWSCTSDFNFELMPEGFEPERITPYGTLIPGKWYKSNIDKSSNKLNFYYIKYSYLKGNDIYGSTIDSDGKYSEYTYWDYNKAIEQAIQFGPVEDLSEIQQYLPEGHPDKVMYKTGYDPYGKSTITPKFDLSNTKIWIGNNPELSEKVQRKAFELGWQWVNRNNEPKYTDATCLYFHNDKYIWGNSDRSKFDKNDRKEIFPSDLGITFNPSVQIVLNPKIEYLNLEFNGKAFCPQQDLLSLQENDGRIDPSVTKTKSIKTELVSEQSIILF
jgi:hypothetical protein